MEASEVLKAVCVWFRFLVQVTADPDFKELLQFVQNSKVAAVDSNITEGISLAIKLLSSNSAKSNDIALKARF